MSDDNFIPLNQSTPNRQDWRQDRNQRHQQHQQQRYYGQHNEPSRSGYNQWRNNSRTGHILQNSSRNNSNSSRNNINSQDRHIDDYILVSMLQDPWEELQREMQQQSWQSNQMNGQTATLNQLDT